MFARLRDFIKPQTSTQKHIDFQRHLIRQEAQIGGQVFGPIGPNRRREFFALMNILGFGMKNGSIKLVYISHAPPAMMSAQTEF